MKRLSLAVIAALQLLAATDGRALTPAHLWSQRLGGSLDDQPASLALTPSGDAVITGSFYGTANFGGGDMVSAGGIDIFIARYGTAGAHQWSRSFGSTGTDGGTGVAVDGSGNVILVGRFSGTVDFGGGDLTSVGGADVVLAKYGPGGAHLWSQRFGGTGHEYPFAVAVDAAGDIFITGYFPGTADFGGGSLVSAGGNDIFIAKYSAAGAHQWSLGLGGLSDDLGAGIGTDASGDVYVTGRFQGTVNLGGGNLVSAGGADVFIAKYSGAGAHQWSDAYGGVSTDNVAGLAVDGSGNVVVTGYFAASVDFGGGSLVSAGGFDTFVAKYQSTGAHVWSQRFGGTSNEFGSAVTVDAERNVVISGAYTGTASFGGGNLVGAGALDIYLAKYDSSGVHQWSRGAGGVLSDNGLGVGVDAAGSVIMTGYFQDAVDFGGGNLFSAGGVEVFLAKYAANAAEPLITSITDIGNDQGGNVRIRFARSGVDDGGAATPVTRYLAFRRDDPAPVAFSNPAPSADGWTEVGSVSAFAESSYGIDVPTVGDSTIALGQYYSVFYIRAATDVPTVFFDSPPDSGYSLDNLAPGVPANLVYNVGVLSWDESAATDFDYFTVYGAPSADFGAATLIDHTVAPSLDVTMSPYAHYFVTATDFSGNEGQPAALGTATGASGAPVRYVLSVGNYPNPFNPRTAVRYTVPARGMVSLTIHDVHGRRIATLVDRVELEAGGYQVEWDGSADGGTPVSSGVYFARIAHDGATRSRKMILLK